MTTENLNVTNTTSQQTAKEMFTNDEVEEIVRRRRDRDAENLRNQIEENKKLKGQLEELESKLQKGTASTEEIQQLQTAKETATKGQQQGYTPDQVQGMVQMAMEQKELENKILDAYQKDPEFKKLADSNKELTNKNAPNGLYEPEILAMSYLPNAVAVAKHLMKDPKAMSVFKTALANANFDRGVSAMMVLNDFSDRLGSKQELAHPSAYEPAAQLPEASDETQAFDLKNYINSKY